MKNKDRNIELERARMMILTANTSNINANTKVYYMVYRRHILHAMGIEPVATLAALTQAGRTSQRLPFDYVVL
jgi:hypothetical protein